jgi:hypothetical protein
MGNGTYWDGATGEWSNLQVDSPFDKAKVYVQSDVPAGTVPVRTGDLFIDTDTRKVQFRNGSSWYDISAGLEVINISDVVNLTTQLAAKADGTATTTALGLKADKASPTFTGTVTMPTNVNGLTKAMVGLGNVDNTTDLLKPLSTAETNALALKADKASPTFTGTVTMPATVNGLTKAMVSLGNVDNTTDLLKPISTATQNALNLKAPIDSPTFTGTVSGVGNTTGNAATATKLSTVRSNWLTNGVITGVVGELAWKNYGNSHTVFDASAGTAPDGTAISNTNSVQAWGATYPTLMGWNGSTTYGVRVDSARVVDAHTHTVAQLSDFATVVSGTLAANNYYEKYANGQLICRGVQSFATGSQAYTWTYPVAFVGQLPQIITNHGTTAPESLASSHSSDALTSVIIEHNRTTAGSTTLYYMAIGRWK